MRRRSPRPAPRPGPARAIAAVTLAVAALAHARPAPPAPRRKAATAARTARAAYDAARAECAAPGPALAALTAELRARLAPDAFGRVVVDGWDALAAADRARFTALAEDRLLRALRAGLTADLCAPGDRVLTVERAHHLTLLGVDRPVGAQHLHLYLTFRDDHTHWTYLGARLPTVDLPETDPYQIAAYWRPRLGAGRLADAVTILTGLATDAGDAPAPASAAAP